MRHTSSWLSRISLAALVTLSACATGKGAGAQTNALTDAERRVELRTSAPEGSYRSVGMVDCRYGGNFKSSQKNVRLCRQELKRDAHAKGASVVAIQNQQVSPEGGNRVVMAGTAYAASESSEPQNGNDGSANTQGSKGAIRQELPSNGDYESLGSATCKYGGNFKSSQHNLRKCRSDLKAKVDQKDGDFIVIQNQSVSPDGGNRVLMTGTIYTETDGSTDR